jgi:hypothetical protein
MIPDPPETGPAWVIAIIFEVVVGASLAPAVEALSSGAGAPRGQRP